ncbi:FMN-binding protein [Treponema sp. Marseille-Q4130]|uniref:FMN-binding protein n=1 Tax=Treponema sp. Marseille-Q4130 TaxID=2766702 RepID=UPI001651D1B4|nr:FMN-binding protein [Treponema sp. Marseille-Q4130]MBC6719506.1 FMN-binding protein [Treponema sp. Marseille-Q4130]
MKKLCVIAAVVIGMCSLYAGGKDVSYKAGTYKGTAKGNNGDITLEVTFSKNAIKSIKVVSHKETPGLSDPAFAKIPDAIVKKQTLAVDAVSGATNTSRAILEAVEKAVKAAGGDATALKK